MWEMRVCFPWDFKLSGKSDLREVPIYIAVEFGKPPVLLLHLIQLRKRIMKCLKIEPWCICWQAESPTTKEQRNKRQNCKQNEKRWKDGAALDFDNNNFWTYLGQNIYGICRMIHTTIQTCQRSHYDTENDTDDECDLSAKLRKPPIAQIWQLAKGEKYPTLPIQHPHSLLFIQFLYWTLITWSVSVPHLCAVCQALDSTAMVLQGNNTEASVLVRVNNRSFRTNGSGCKTLLQFGQALAWI